jgi:hypothetical protein
MPTETYNTIHEDNRGDFYAATHPSEALPACWQGPCRAWPLEAARDLGGHADEALQNFLADREDPEAWEIVGPMKPGDLVNGFEDQTTESFEALAVEFPGVEFEFGEMGLRARL